VGAFASHRYTDLEFNAPMSSTRVRDLIDSLQPLTDATIVDFGCGWAEFLLRAVEHEPTAHGIGIDRDSAAIARARTNAEARGLRDRVRLECGDVTRWSDQTGVAVVIGASQAWGGTRETLNAVRTLLGPGGRFLFGEAIWQQPPTPAALRALDARTNDYTTVAGLVDLCLDSGYRLLEVSTATLNEWDNFEAGYCAGPERWLWQHLDSPAADETRAEIDAHRDAWLHGYRGVLGFAYLTLVAPTGCAPQTRGGEADGAAGYREGEVGAT
jgi:cyclopropane fatty-acyl-phospholipid synthase-like methyltransferase